MSSPATGSTGTQSIDRAADLLARIVRAQTPMTFTELADATGLARSTTSRILAALERADLLTRDSAGAWAPGALFEGYAVRRTAADALALTDQAEQDVLGADVVVAELECFSQRQLEDLLGPRREGDVARRRAAALADDLFDLLTHRL